MNVKERMAEQKAARDYWSRLTTSDKWLLGDVLVLGEFDWRDWFHKKPSRAFLNEIDQERILWEMKQ